MAPGGPHWPLRGPDTPPFVLAHRGDAARWRENTLDAFRAAREAGADGVELDARLSADGVAVVHHDRDVPGAGPVDECARGALPVWLPSLADALAACAGLVVDVELKASPLEPGFDPTQRLARTVARMVGGSSGPAAPAAVLLTSFWPEALAAVREEGPELVTGLLVHPALEAGAALEQAAALGCRAILPFHAQVDGPLVAGAHDAGLGVVPWTVNGEERLRAVLALGVDGLVTDEPGLAMALRTAGSGA